MFTEGKPRLHRVDYSTGEVLQQRSHDHPEVVEWRNTNLIID